MKAWIDHGAIVSFFWMEFAYAILFASDVSDKYSEKIVCESVGAIPLGGYKMVAVEANLSNMLSIEQRNRNNTWEKGSGI